MQDQNLFEQIKSPEKPFCDIVMKGGITSGVVYPLAVVELAAKYRFKNIGGTSAGAIAAAVAAAAEVGREKRGFEKLADMNQEIAVSLADFFQATPETEPLLETLKAALGDKTFSSRLIDAFKALVMGFKWISIGIVVVTLLLAITFAVKYHLFVGVSIGLLGLVIWVGVIAWRMFSLIKYQLPQQGFGVCPGLTQKGAQKPAITDWLCEKLEDLAAMEVNAGEKRPLTFGDLHGKDARNPLVNLEVITSNLAESSPYTIPFKKNIFFFKAGDLKTLFPGYVVDWMVKKSNPLPDKKGFTNDVNDPYRYLPFTENLPVIFAVRLSLSFPFLLSAVPLYARDYNLQDEEQRLKPVKCWFSDGGICSNFPVHLFDGVIPAWPTFAVTLEKFEQTHHDEQERVSLPEKANAGILKNLRQESSTFGFVAAIIDTMQEWQDNLQSASPAFRHRIVRIRLKEEEGGLNLTMPEQTVKQLAEYGRMAGIKLRDDFDWDRHRWSRYVNALAGYDKSHRNLLSAWQYSSAFTPDYATFVQQYAPEVVSWRQNKAWLQSANDFITSLQEHAADETYQHLDDSENLPKPEMGLRMMPQFWSTSSEIYGDNGNEG